MHAVMNLLNLFKLILKLYFQLFIIKIIWNKHYLKNKFYKQARILRKNISLLYLV